MEPTLNDIYKTWPETKEGKLQALVAAKKVMDDAEDLVEQLKSELFSMMDRGESQAIAGRKIVRVFQKKLQDTLMAREWCKANGFKTAIREKLDTKEARRIMEMHPEFEALLQWTENEYIRVGNER